LGQRRIREPFAQRVRFSFSFTIGFRISDKIAFGFSFAFCLFVDVQIAFGFFIAFDLERPKAA